MKKKPVSLALCLRLSQKHWVLVSVDLFQRNLKTKQLQGRNRHVGLD